MHEREKDSLRKLSDKSEEKQNEVSVRVERQRSDQRHRLYQFMENIMAYFQFIHLILASPAVYSSTPEAVPKYLVN